MRRLKLNKIVPAFILGFFLLTSCNKDEDGKGTGSFYITDAPIDDANVEAVFVTVADLKVDGESVEGFSKQTIELSAYQNGKTEQLHTGEFEANSYSELTLVLDYDNAEDGSSPGTYVLTSNGEKKALSNSSSGMGEFTSTMDLELTDGDNKKMVMDFDLRKAISYKEGSSSEFELVASSQSETVVRTVDQDKSSRVEGKANDKSQFGVEGQVVAYLYKKGEFDKSSETSGDLMFKNAVTSTMVQENGDYTLAFVEEGEYELHFANYEDEDQDGKSEFKGMLEVSGMVNGSLGSIDIQANANVELDVEFWGLL